LSVDEPQAYSASALTGEQEGRVREICREEIQAAHGEEAAEELREVQEDKAAD